MDILNDILACASVGLDSLYPDYPVNVEFIPNELPPRCFLLGFAGEVDIKHSLGSRYEVSGKLDIAYIAPKRGDISCAENNTVFARISLELRHLSYNGVRIRLGEHVRRDVDDVLHIICAFRTFLYKLNETPVMQELTQRPVIK